jgi:hypothetical protein
MPEEKSKKTVDIDTSGPGADVDVAEEKVKEEEVVETEATETEPVTTEEEPTEKEIKEEPKKDDEQLEEYSKGVQSRISKLTRKMREAERQRDAATEYARAAETSRQTLEKRFVRADSDYIKKFESSIKEGMDAAQKDLAHAIESGDAKAQVEANKRIATLAFDNAKLEQSKEVREEIPATPAKPADVREPQQPSSQLPRSDPQAEAWASKNTWFGQDRPMTFTAFEIHKDLVDKEGFDPNSDEYYAEVDKRIRVDFPHKFGTSDNKYTTEPVQTVASAKRSVKPGRQTVRLTSSQVAIAKKLGVPLEEYAKQLKNTKGVVSV